jgi:hypothetical protein
VKYKIVYFTRTGTSKGVVEKLSNKLSCEAIQVTDNMNWKGIIGFIKAGYYSQKNKSVEIKIHGNLDDAEEFIVVSPLWAGGLAPAIRVLLRNLPLEKIHLVVTSKGSNLQDRSGFKSVSDIVKSKNDEDVIINNLVKTLL